MSKPSDHADVNRREGFGSLGLIVHVLVVGWGALVGLLPLDDNSFFTHLATGRLILDHGVVPSMDPYSFTAHGEPWTVQSWLASVVLGAAEQIGGLSALRILVVLAYTCAASMVWRLTKDARSLLPRLLLASLAMVVCSGVWSERPYMIGFLGLCVVWLALHDRCSHWWLVPGLWVWANSHGSFPLAFVLIVTVAIGSILDERSEGRAVDLHRELLAFRSATVGMALALLSPLGWRLIVFPISALRGSERFSVIVEWQAPNFTSASERAFLLLAVGAVVALIVSPRWREAVPAVVFVTAALLAQRNVVMAIPVLVPVIARVLPEVGSLTATTRPALGRAIAVGCVALLCVSVVVGLTSPGLTLDGYPGRSLVVAAERGDGRLLTEDFTGNLLEAVDGAGADVFMDDRVDMFPTEVIKDYEVLNRGGVTWSRVLAKYGIHGVVWSRADPLSSLLALDPAWRVVFSDATSIYAVRREARALKTR